MYDIVIIGAGPAGLSVGCALEECTNKSFVIIDCGKDIDYRDHNSEQDIITGVGGAGLFSDGKFSFWPSSTLLWLLSNKSFLKKAYEWYKNNLLKQNEKLSIPDFPDIKENKSCPDKWTLKEYKSVYLSLKERINFIKDLHQTINGIGKNRFMMNTSVVSVDKKENHYLVKTQDVHGKTREIQCLNVIVAGGRYWPLFNLNSVSIKIPSKFVRFEYGVRIQTSSTQKFFTSTMIKDPKYIYSNTKNSVEYRTFCCCRDGEVVITSYNGIKTCSGRSDCEPTKLSNVGFNVKIYDKTVGDAISSDFKKLEGKVFKNLHAKDIDSEYVKDTLSSCYGEIGGRYLVEGLKIFFEKFPEMRDSTLLGPTIEGVGEYPVTDDNLKVPDENIWVVGDSCGKFRGITAGMVSGYYVGQQFVKSGDE